MKYFLPILLFLHGAIHLTGFVKAFQFATIEQLTVPITKVSGVFWLFAFLFFMAAGIVYLTKGNYWYGDYWSILAMIAVTLSTVLILYTWKDAKFGTIANIIILVAAIIGYGTATFFAKYEKDVIENLEQTSSVSESILTEADIVNLPLPVQKYIRYSHSLGKPKVNSFKAEFKGKIRKDELSEWMPFTTEQYNFTDVTTRLFYMKAVMKHLPVEGYHCFKNGNASMDIRLLSLFRVQYQDGPEMDTAETVTFFNDMCCLSPASLIDKRIKWLEVKENKVKAEFTGNNITIAAWLYFNDKGELINFISNDRLAIIKDSKIQKIPWSTPMKDYKEVDGFRLFTSADVIWSYPKGDFCYGTFSLTHIKYNCKQNS